MATHENLDVHPIAAFRNIRKLHKIAIWYHYKFSAENIEVEMPDYQIPMESINKIGASDKQNALSASQKIKEYVDDSAELQNNLLQISSRTIADPSILDEQLAREEFIKNNVDINDVFVSSSDDEQNLSSGEIIRSRYKILDVLGSGSFGITYLAEDLDKPNKNLCVVKELSPSSAYGSSGRNTNISDRIKSLFNQEATILSQFKHPEIPSLQAFFEERNRFFLVQDFVEGYTLTEEFSVKLEAGELWEESAVVDLIKNILSPLKYVHDISVHGREIIHRDVKPDNLIRRADDNKIVLIDFGAVKQIVDENSNQGSIMGTRGYMSPEQTRGYILPSCDVYAVGIIAIEAIYGKRINDLDNTKAPYQLVADMQNISSEFKSILLKMTCNDYSDRYANAIEAFNAIDSWENEPTTLPPVIQSPPTSSQANKSTLSQPSNDLLANHPVSQLPNSRQRAIPESKALPKSKPHMKSSTLKPKKKSSLPTLIIGTTAIAALGIGFYSLPYFTKVKLSRSEITIGTLWKPESIQGLVDYLENNTVPANYLDFIQGKKVKFRINGDSTLGYKEAAKRIESKQWDVAFSTSPILSLSAKEHEYTHIAGMFPTTNVYQSALFVRKDSLIQSIKDIGNKTRVALGAFNSASSFYMPVYDLYGKTIIANVGHRGTAILNLVREGKADVGSAAIGDSVRKDDPDFRIIHVSRDIPGAGVYTSPNLSGSESKNLKQLMLIAPQDIRTQANYGDKSEPDYTEFKKITQRVEEILICSDFSINPVILGCADTIKSIEGVVNSASVDGNNFILKFSADNQVYNVTITREVVKQTIGGDKLTDVQGLTLLLKFDKLGSGNKITINQGSQIKVLQQKL
jgi:serine/threonine-protein kinase